MALIKCKECGHLLSTEASTCPGCGAKNPRTKLSTWIIGGIFAIMVFQCTSSSIDKDKRDAQKTPEQKAQEQEQAIRSDAKFACRSFVEKSLKAPSTAEFQNYDQFTIIGGVDGSYIVGGYVDAQNSFGAKLRTKFHCTVTKTGDNWQLLKLTND